ncbi:hypothetical protein [Sulfobacillus thermosulfidooxidans]|uniref:hypothetical protein n=1 Tax=Sulfobacillus thermosulfidooxidans TaxID=28034 RepID=UPI00096BA053|nr:hypothetical protein [Sulfobacillus thermosulfidooxidans]OLZ11639.1 hypothetical protein BFX05_06470 [Sulfobacillus thermosulfidooxidans]OLZ18602.1 hypothetical protein BFX06_00065 [Sulfobacillus thermosulfidooxidans]OLZ22359.1 hypothetical protein BFX07_09645 [Sulfobacillus thermosulfidooxidans]
MNTTGKTISVIGGGLVAIGLLYTGISFLLPPILPAPSSPSQTVSTIRHHHIDKTHRVSSKTTSSVTTGPNGMTTLIYNPAIKQTALKLAKGLGIHLLLPSQAYPGTTLVESYVDDSVLNLEFNDMIAMESKNPIMSSYQPGASVNVTLANGVPAEWLLIYGVGGGAYRLLFEKDGTYVRLQLFHGYIPAGLQNAEEIADQFMPVS